MIASSVAEEYSILILSSSDFAVMMRCVPSWLSPNTNIYISDIGLILASAGGVPGYCAAPGEDGGDLLNIDYDNGPTNDLQNV